MGTSSFSSYREIDIPFPGLTLPPGNFILGLQYSQGTVGAIATQLLWGASLQAVQRGFNASVSLFGGAATNLFPGIGAFSTNAAWSTFDWRSASLVTNIALYGQLMAAS